MKNLTRAFSSHPDGWSQALRMDFEGFKAGGWTHARPLELQNGAGYVIKADFSWCDGFRCWKYWATRPDGKSLGAYSKAEYAAMWIDRDMRSARHAG